MGNSFSSKNSVWVQTDKQVYRPGELVQAVVCLNIVDPVELEGIKCKLKGKEKTWFHVQVHRDGNTFTEPRWGSHTFLQATHDLPGTARRFEPGMYQWCVALALPQDTLASLYTGNSYEGGEVGYRLKATCDVKGFLKSDIKHKQKLSVTAADPPTAARPAEASTDDTVKTCCCFSRGSIHATLRLDRDWARPGEAVGLVLTADNRTKLPVQRIELEVAQEAHLRDGKSSWASHKKLKRDLWEMGQEGTAPFTSVTRRAECLLPHDLAPTVEGAILTCCYRARAIFKMGTSSSNVKVYVPIRIVGPAAAAPPAAVSDGAHDAAAMLAAPPAFWDPSEVHTSAWEVPSAPPLPADALSPSQPFWVRCNSGAAGAAGAASSMPVV